MKTTEETKIYRITDGNGAFVVYLTGTRQEALNAASRALLVGSARVSSIEERDEELAARAEYNACMERGLK